MCRAANVTGAARAVKPLDNKGKEKDKGAEGARELWPVMLKYFDGRYALEEISAREGVKKRRIREFWGRLVREGWLVTVRHW